MARAAPLVKDEVVEADPTGQGQYGDRNGCRATVVNAVTLDRNLFAMITAIAIIGAGIRVGRGRVM